VFFSEGVHPNGTKLYSARIIPYRGSWVEFDTDMNDVLFVHIDSRRKLHATTLLRAIGFSTNDEIVSLFYKTTKIPLTGKKGEQAVGRFAAESVIDKESGEIVINAGEEITAKLLDKLTEAGKKELLVTVTEERREANLGVVQNINSERPSFLARILNFGSVTIETAGIEPFTFDYVKDPGGVQAEIFRRTEAFRARQREQEADRRRSELLDWFSVYDQIRGTPPSTDTPQPQSQET